MKMKVLPATLVALVLAYTSQVSATDSQPTMEQMWEIIKSQQEQIEALQRGQHETARQAADADDKAEAAVEAVEQTQADNTTYLAGAHGGRGKTTVGGYGELHYNNLDNQLTGGADKKEIDFHRAILFLGHEFNDRIRFWSELEVEHAQAGDGKDGGEVSMEQAYVEFDLNERLSSRAGILLVPMGIINETHEPPTFYGTERNPVENRIIPTTWREGGVSLNGRFGEGLSYDLALHSGLETDWMNVDPAKKYAVRGGRQSVREALAEDLAYTGRLKWTGMAGVELAAALQYQSDITQSLDPTAGSATLFETHAIWNKGPFGLRALYASWDLNGAGPAAVGANEQTGWYIEPSWKIMPTLGLFTRYNQWDNQAGDTADSEYTQVDVGLNYWPHPDVVLKADYQVQNAPVGESEFDGFNLGIGYQF